MFYKGKNIILKLFQYFIFGFVIIFCFIFFPLFWLDSFIDVYLKSNIENNRQSIINEMNNSIEYLNKYSNNKKYFHFLLSEIAEIAQKNDKPLDYLKFNINNLKKNYPNQFIFYVWDDKGKIIEYLCDRKGYNYVLNKIYTTLYDVTSILKEDSSIKIANIESIKNNINILNNFFGRIFVAENLKNPIMKDISSGPLLTELGHDYNYVWFSIKPKVSFLCFISDQLINEHSGLYKIAEKINRNDSNIIYGFSTINDYYKPITPFPKKYESDFSLALSIFENGGSNIFENSRAIFKMSMPQPDVRTFSFLPKLEEKWNLEQNKKRYFYIAIIFLLVIYSFIGFKFFYKKNFFSIRWKLIIIFLIANLIPLSILALITNIYIENKRLSLKNDVIDNLDKSIRELDVQYNTLLEDYSSKLNNEINNVSKKIGNSLIKQYEINELNSLYNKFNSSYLILVSSSSQIISYKTDNKKNKLSKDFIENLGKYVLNFLNNKNIKIERSNIYSYVFNPDDSGFIKTYIRKIGRFNDLILGEGVKTYYSNIFGDKDNYNNNYLFMLMWDKEDFQNLFVKKYFEKIYKNNSEYEYYIKYNLGNYRYGSAKLEKILNNILEKKAISQEKISGDIIIDEEKYIFSCINVTNLKNWSILATYPEKNIDKKIKSFIFQVISGAFVSILLTIIIGYILSNQFIKPIDNIGEATLALEKRNFSFRIPIGDKDEFGYLNQTFNNALEGLEDFEVAKIVQNSLFPGNSFKAGILDIYGKSITMTTLGGDYYDCFKINDDYWGVIIGDVSGHGIPAGLVMATAKSAILSSSEEIKLNPSLLTDRVNSILYFLNSNNLKRMMTFQYFIFNINNGHVIYTNAGHCYPIIFDKNLKTANHIVYTTTPLGIRKISKCKNMEFDLNKNQSLVLYTDCIIEATDELGEQYGYDRFKLAVTDCYDTNPENFYNNLYNNVYKQWASKVDDDFTMIIINRV